MELYRKSIYSIPVIMVSALLCLIQPAFTASAQTDKKLKLKTVVIDPGHGGKDAGCVSKDKKTYEKNLTLSISKLFGEKIKEAYPDVSVIYTRSTDKYLTLNQRAETANKNNADLFVSIHINSVPSTSPHGFSTHILGQSSDKNKDLFAGNMDICRRENSVIMLEEDYSTNYQGFDPGDPESFIFFNLMQNAFYEQSLLFATDIDAALSKGPIKHSRGVWQDPFLVLWKTTMPSVLIEAGFMSNSSDLQVLRSESGRNAIAQKLFEAFKVFKSKYDRSIDFQVDEVRSPEPPKPVERTENKPVTVDGNVAATSFGVQIFVLSRLLPANDRTFKGLEAKPVKSGSVYKYVVEADSASEAKRIRTEIKKKFPDSFPVKIENGTVTRLK